MKALMHQLFDREFVHPQDQAFLGRLMQQDQQFDFFDLLDEVTAIQNIKFSLLWRIEDSGPIAAYLFGRALMWPFQLLKFIF